MKIVVGLSEAELKALEETSDRNMVTFYKEELLALDAGDHTIKFPASVRHRMNKLKLLVDSSRGLVPSEKAKGILAEAEARTS